MCYWISWRTQTTNLEKNSCSQKSTLSNAVSTAPSFDLFSKPADHAPIISSAFIFYLLLTLRLQWRKDPKEQQQRLHPSSEAMQAMWDWWSCAGLKCQNKAANRRTNIVSRLSEHLLGRDAYTRDQSQLPGQALLQCLWHGLGELQGWVQSTENLACCFRRSWVNCFMVFHRTALCASWQFSLCQPEFLNLCAMISAVAQHCSEGSANGDELLWLGEAPCECTSPFPSSPNTPAFRPSLNRDYCIYIMVLGFFFCFQMTAILFNITTEELCSVFLSSEYKSSLNLSLKCSHCHQERIWEVCPRLPLSHLEAVIHVL